MRRRLVVVTLVVAALLAIAAAATAAIGLELLPPHHARRSAATLDAPLRAALAERIAAERVGSTHGAIQLALGFTAAQLHFGLSHPTRLSFSREEREANCIEFAHLFARALEATAKGAELDLDAYVVHSDRARLFGQRVPMPGWQDHDWVLVVERGASGERRFFVDPTMHDAGLAWDVSGAVRGSVRVPR